MIRRRISSGVQPLAPNTPKPPALETAATSSGPAADPHAGAEDRMLDAQPLAQRRAQPHGLDHGPGVGPAQVMQRSMHQLTWPRAVPIGSGSAAVVITPDAPRGRAGNGRR